MIHLCTFGRLTVFSLIVGMMGFIASSLQADGDAGGVRVGNGGDWRRIMLGQAQREGANWVNTAALNRNLFEQDMALDKMSLVFRFVMADDVLKNLAADMIASHHFYKESSETPRGEYTTCAWTNDPASQTLNDIVFSLNLCEIGLRDGGQSFANRLLIHESIHHLLRNDDLRAQVGAIFAGTAEQKAQQEDQFCDDVAVAIQRVFELVVRNGKPHWRDLDTPHFMQGGKDEIFQPRGFHASVWTGPVGDDSIKNKLIVWGGCREGDATIYACGGDRYFNDGAIYNQTDGTWSAMGALNAPVGRAEAQSIWTGDNAPDSLKNLFIVWGGCRDGDGCGQRLGDGGMYSIEKNRWMPIPATSDAVSPRVHHSLVWTGREMIVWGGHPNNAHGPSLMPPLADGGIYDPATKKWRKLGDFMQGAPSARGFHFAVWTGATGHEQSSQKMLIIGGCVQEIADSCSQIRDDAAFFDPKTMTWSKMTTSGEAYVPRHNGSFLHVPSQNRIYMFGGFDSDSNVISQGQILDLKTMKIYKMSAMGEGRFKHRAVWAGDKMLIFGGKYYSSARTYELATSVLGYTPGAQGTIGTGIWREYMTDEIIPLKSIESTAVWTGSSMMVWGGQVFDRGFTNYGSEFFTGW
jgi:hypothetical protein